jgi:multifunctional beta-oxidation protein
MSGDTLSKIETAKKLTGPRTKFTYTDRDTILYNLSIGATTQQPHLIYENHPSFVVLPTFGAIPASEAEVPYDLSQIFTNYDPNKLLAGEYYLELHAPIPTEGTLLATCELVEILDKGKDAVVTRSTTVTTESGTPVCYAENTSFLPRCGGYGGPRKSTRNIPSVIVPSRAPDHIATSKTSPEQAVLYRLFGDLSPIHVDPKSAQAAGFDVPISHGMSTFGVAGMHVLEAYGTYRSIRGRFAGAVRPGDTLVTEMWRVGDEVVFQVRVGETGKLAVSGGLVVLAGER